MRRATALAAWLLLAPVAVAMAVAAALAQTPPDAAAQRLLALLRAAPDEQTAALLEGRVIEAWQRRGSPAAAMLLQHGMSSLMHEAPGEATGDFDAALALEPDYAQAYADRALAKLAAGDTGGAVRDAAEALRREPSHFGALQTLSRVAEARHDWKAALEAWQRVLALDPKTPQGEQRLNLLRRNAEGEAT